MILCHLDKWILMDSNGHAWHCKRKSKNISKDVQLGLKQLDRIVIHKLALLA